MREDVTAVFEKLLAANRDQPDYRAEASLDSSRAVVHLTLIFKANVRYCCAEPGCHVSALSKRFWSHVRSGISEAGLSVPPTPLRLRTKGIVERGALLTSNRQLGLPEFSDSFEYDEDFYEERAVDLADNP